MRGLHPNQRERAGRARARGASALAVKAALVAAALACLAGARGEDFARPHGLFILDGAGGTPWNGETLRDANIRSYPFVSGYTLRVWWDFVESAPGAYDWAIFDNIFAKLPAGQKLSIILSPYDPSYIAQAPGAIAWQDEDRDGLPLTRCVPWDPYLRERRHAYIEALAAHEVGGVALRDRPEFAVVNTHLPGGHTGIRDPGLMNLHDMTGYTRAILLATVQDELRLLTDNFPNQFMQIGFWKVLDHEGGLEAWEEIRQALLAEFNGVARPRIGFFMENLAANRPAPGADPVTGLPTTTFGAPLYLSQGEAWTAFQALTSWKRPFGGKDDKVANATPFDGMQYAYDTYGTRYFEIYIPDIDNTDWHADFQTWHDLLEGGSSTVAGWRGY